MGIMLGLALIAAFEFLNKSARRPEDLIRKLDVWPIATIPYVRSRSEMLIQSARRMAVILVIVVGVPATVWSVHTYYQPLDLIADRAMNKLGVRW